MIDGHWRKQTISEIHFKQRRQANPIRKCPRHVDSTDKPINDFVSVPKLANQHFLYSGFARYHDDNGVAVSFEEGIRLTKLNGKNYSEIPECIDETGHICAIRA